MSAICMGYNTFTEIMRETGLSRKTVAYWLRILAGEGLIRKEGRKWKLAGPIPLDYGPVQRVVFSTLSTKIFNDLFEVAGRISHEEFLDEFTRKVGLLAVVAMLIGLEVSTEDFDDKKVIIPKYAREGAEWIERAFATPFQKYAWRRCLFRQVYGGPYRLKEPVELDDPAMIEFTKEGDKILVKPTAAYGPKTTEKILSNLPEVPQERLKGLWDALRRMYPREAKVFEEILELIGIEIGGGRDE